MAVVPRERFRLLPPSLRSLFKTISVEVPVIVVDGGAPEHVRKELRALQAERPFDLIECEDFVLPNKARNIALDLVKTKYMAFCDSDLGYWPGWLDALVTNAEANDSVAVSPVTLIGPSNPPTIHHAGGSFSLREYSPDRRILTEIHHYDGVPLNGAEEEIFARAPLCHKNFEYHCVLVNTAAMRAIGGHDERLVIHEHLDSSLRLLAAGGRLTFESAARVMYRAFERFKREDWPYFLFRWTVRWARDSDRIFMENWGVDKDHSSTMPEWIEQHRERAMFTALPPLPKPFRRLKFKRALLAYYRPRILRLDPDLPDNDSPLILPKPPMDGLERAGVTPN